MPNQTVKNSLKRSNYPKWNTFSKKKKLIKFSCTYQPLSFCKIKKKFFCCRSRVMRMRHFGAQNSPFAPNKTLFWKIISFSFTYWPFSFFSKSVNKYCSFYSCLSTCQKSKSNTNLLRKHWRLKILKSHWLRAILGYNLRTRFFPSVQLHKFQAKLITWFS